MRVRRYSALDQDLLLQARSFVDEHLSPPLSVAQVWRWVHFSPFHFIQLFRRTFHQTPHQYSIQRRIERAKRLLVECDLTVTEICYDVGFESLSSFSILFRKRSGESPRAYRRQQLDQKQNPEKYIPACFLIMNRIADWWLPSN